MDYKYGNLGSKNIFEKIKKTKKIYIETGLWKGGGVDWAINHFDTVHSIEFYKPFYDLGVEKYKDNSKVKLHFGDSRIKLPEILDSLNESCFIFLDAHGDIKDFPTGNPLYQELKSLKDNSVKNHIILIDDIRRMGDMSDPCWSKIDINELKKLLKDINEEYMIFEFKDTLIACLEEDINTRWTIPYNE
jgi:hypothetical protein